MIRTCFRISERIVMTPRKRGAGHTCIAVERVRVERVDTSQAVHVAGGQHQGIVINKENQCGDSNEAGIHARPCKLADSVLSTKVW